jgi:phosphoglycolate phosphatase-like HAD superfamily hydrolase
MHPTHPTSTAPAVEVLRGGAIAARARAVLFDFDGTLSLIRSGWAGVMVPMMVEALAGLKPEESAAELTVIVREFVDRLTGKQTICQMIELARQIELRGGTPAAPLVYKRRYLELLHQRISGRLEELRTRRVPADKYLVPGARELLKFLRSRGLTLYLASGTDHQLVVDEARLLEVDGYFNGGIFGALDDYKQFSKRKLIVRLLSDHQLAGEDLLAFGDGYVEIGNVRQVGGAAVGVATDEPVCRRIDAWKRTRLVEAGADLIIANFECLPELSRELFAI